MCVKNVHYTHGKKQTLLSWFKASTICLVNGHLKIWCHLFFNSLCIFPLFIRVFLSFQGQGSERSWPYTDRWAGRHLSRGFKQPGAAAPASAAAGSTAAACTAAATAKCAPGAPNPCGDESLQEATERGTEAQVRGRQREYSPYNLFNYHLTNT